MSKLYTVISNDYEDGSAWFYNDKWDDNGIWCLDWSMVEELTETN